MISNRDREKILNALKLILVDEAFKTSPKSSAFLRFVVMQTLDGNGDRIKAYTIAVDALGKPSTFDPQGDPSVRVMAKRLRDMLDVYYEKPLEHEVVVHMQPGSYVPQFVIPNNSNQSDNFNNSSCS